MRRTARGRAGGSARPPVGAPSALPLDQPPPFPSAFAEDRELAELSIDGHVRAERPVYYPDSSVLPHLWRRIRVLPANPVHLARRVLVQWERRHASNRYQAIYSLRGIEQVSRLSNPRWPKVIAVAIGLVIGSAIVGLSDSPAQPQASAGCIPGGVIANVTNAITPLILLNSPYGTTRATWSAQTSYLGNGTNFTLHAWNGSVSAYYVKVNYTIRGGVGNPASGSSCSSRYFATPSSRTGGIGLSLGPYQNDSLEPSEFPTANGSVVAAHYWNGFYTETSVVSTCGIGASTIETVTSTHLTVSVAFSFDGSIHTANATLSQNTTFHYTFPSNTGVWAVDNLSASAGPGGGWAFSYSPCP